jgi:hypothetical protein
MKLLFLVLNRVEKLDDILTAFLCNDIKGATVIDSIGMARLLSCKHDEDEISFLSSLRVFLNPEREKSNIILTVIQDSQLDIAVSVIESVIGDLSAKDNGVVFSVPVDFAKGIM